MFAFKIEFSSSDPIVNLCLICFVFKTCDICFQQITEPTNAEELPPLPEPEGTVLKNHLKQVCARSNTLVIPLLILLLL